MFGICISWLLQMGVTVAELEKKFGYQEFEPKGRSEEPGIGFARSIVDYAARWMARLCPERGYGVAIRQEADRKGEGE